MVRTDQMWRYVREVKIEHRDAPCGQANWQTVVEVAESKHQGWDFHLECGCKLQSCFDETEIEVQVNWSEDVLNWGKTPA